MKQFWCIFFLLYITHFMGQVGGESVYQFLNVSTSARQVALGGEALTVMDDVSQPIWNPSVINSNLDNQLAVNYSSYLAGVNMGSLSYAKSISRRAGTLHGSIQYLDYGSIIGADENGLETGNFRANDIAISIGYARNIPNSNIYVGSNIKIINSNISTYSSFGVAVDLAILYHNVFQPYSFTIVARNLGIQIKSFNGVQEQLPFKVAVGGAYQLQYVPLKWYFTLDNLQQWQVSVDNPSNETVDLYGNVSQEKIGFLNDMFRHFIIGAELFSEHAVNIRAGYNFRRSQELSLQNARTFSGISLGFGIKMNKFKFNYAYSKFHAAANTNTFSLLIDFDSK